jgi:hypothetical protein
LGEIVKYKTYVEILAKALSMRENLIAQAKAETKSSAANESGDAPPEPWFDLNSSAPTSVGTVNTKDTRGGKDDAT